MPSSSPQPRVSAGTVRLAGGQWTSDVVPAVQRPACWWALLIGAPPTAPR